MAITALRRIFCRRTKTNSAGGFLRDDDGNTIVEFALVAPLFFTALLSIFEVAMMFGTNVALEAATTRAARSIRTGQVFISSLPSENVTTQRTTFETVLCDALILIKCSELSYNVESFATFAAADGAVSCNSAGDIEGSTPVPDGPAAANFDVGLPNQIVVLTIMYPYRPIIPNPLTYAGRDWKSAGEGGCNGLSMQSVLVFSNEPFPTTL